MSQNNFISSGDFQYTPSNNLTTLQNVYASETNSLQTLVLDLHGEIKSFKSEISSLKEEIKELKDGNKRAFTKLTEEVIAVKLENRRHHNDITSIDEFEDLQKLPLAVIADLEKFHGEIQHNKEFIAKTGGDGPAKFLRTAGRKVFCDELASAYSWKGTSLVPSAEKCFLITTIKNIGHLKYKSTDQEMNGVLQKHFVHAKDRIAKRKLTRSLQEKTGKNSRN
ncbi:PREDICTED: uncharacterized protein LOC108361075 [Rhagoletis zephyria]|uniref:uncharacterized protein LOC108361075 n=1 Tax=Rhagoletis zephyria TaxID=28612 RepID=UPI0008116ABF|nr:PREDICTED: uncharacterized protein LOC108361075 [Rhagoletis zephyria]XP_036317804.1 uncharacterized protein LOC118732801 [Rhagoletis pomonella]